MYLPWRTSFTPAKPSALLFAYLSVHVTLALAAGWGWHVVGQLVGACASAGWYTGAIVERSKIGSPATCR